MPDDNIPVVNENLPNYDDIIAEQVNELTGQKKSSKDSGRNSMELRTFWVGCEISSPPPKKRRKK